MWLPKVAQALHGRADDDGATGGFLFAGPRGRPVNGLEAAMRAICAKLGVERATPHDLRRTHGSTITALGFGRDAMNRIQNHKEGGIASVYDRHGYAEETKRIMEAVASQDHGAGGGPVGWRQGGAASLNLVRRYVKGYKESRSLTKRPRWPGYVRPPSRMRQTFLLSGSAIRIEG